MGACFAFIYETFLNKHSSSIMLTICTRLEGWHLLKLVWTSDRNRTAAFAIWAESKTCEMQNEGKSESLVGCEHKAKHNSRRILECCGTETQELHRRLRGSVITTLLRLLSEDHCSGCTCSCHPGLTSVFVNSSTLPYTRLPSCSTDCPHLPLTSAQHVFFLQVMLKIVS